MEENKIIEETNNDRCYTVYMHTSPSNKRYIGITRQNVKNRWKNGYGYQVQPYFWRAIQKYGWDNFKHEILYADLTKNEAEDKEKELIIYYKSNNNNFGYNVENGGNCVGKVSAETKKKLSEANKKENLSKETLAKRSESMKGKIHSEETKKKLSDLWYNAHQDSNCRKVLQYSKDGILIKIWDSISEAGRAFNVNPSLISQCCIGNRKIIAGYIWKYENEELNQDEVYWRNTRTPYPKKMVLQYSKDGILINEYSDVPFASLSTGVNIGNIYQCCRRDKKTAGGFIWRYVDDENNEFRQAI